jgi:tetratricopeptide (TPR) repeat protein
MDVRRDGCCHRCATRLACDNHTGYCAPCQAVSRDRFVAPLDVPPDFWDNQAIRDALAVRHLGRVIRAYRYHPFHGRQPLPQGVVAAWLGVSQGQLSRIEKGPPLVYLDRLIYWARLLRIPPSLLWFTLPEDGRILASPADRALENDSDHNFVSLVAANDRDVSLWWAPADAAAIVRHFTRRDLTLDRREAARILASVVFGNALLEPLERWLAADPAPPIAGRPGAIGYQEMAQIEHAARIFRDWDDQFGGGLRRKAVIGQLNEVADLLQDSYPTEIRQRLFGAMAQLAETAAIMSWDSGQQALAQRYYVLALRACKPAADVTFAANIMAGMARQLLYLGHFDDALELTRVAQDTAGGHLTPTVRAMLYTREAWAYAKQGRITAFRRATSKAEDALAAAQPSNDPYWISYFDAAELAGTTGGRLLDLAHEHRELADETVAHIEQAIAVRQPGRLRSSALDQIGLAETRLIQGELEEACRLGHAAVAMAEQTSSDRVRVKLAELYQHSTSHAKVPAIAALRDRMRSVFATQSNK